MGGNKRKPPYPRTRCSMPGCTARSDPEADGDGTQPIHLIHPSVQTATPASHDRPTQTESANGVPGGHQWLMRCPAAWQAWAGTGVEAGSFGILGGTVVPAFGLESTLPWRQSFSGCALSPNGTGSMQVALQFTGI